jgi:hypothetical protein
METNTLLVVTKSALADEAANDLKDLTTEASMLQNLNYIRQAG